MATLLGLVSLAGASDSALASSSVTVRGLFRTIHADRPLSESTVYAIEDARGRLYELKGRGAWRHTSTGTRVEVRGEQDGDVITASSVDEVAPAAGPRAAPAPVTGSRRILVVNVVWSGATLQGTPAQEDTFLFGTTDPQRRSTKQYYEDVSYGQLSLTGSETPLLTIANPGSCSLSRIANSADGAARAAGYALTAYDHTMYSMPDRDDCDSAGWGEVGGRRSWIVDSSWDVGYGYARLIQAHELGHNLGEDHGHGLECGAAVATTTCLGSADSIVEYGASYDVMGSNWTANGYDSVNWMALPHQLNLGWLAGAGRVTTVRYPGPTQPANYVVKPIESASGTVGLVLDTPTRQYYVEGRSAVGQDAFLSNWPATTAGVLISVRNDIPDTDDGPLGLDAHPTLSAVNNDFFDAALNVGESFRDVDGTFVLKLDGVGSGGATVRVTPPPDTTPPAVPRGLAATPGDRQVSLSWTANAEPDLARYHVYLDGVRKATVTASNVTVTGLSNGTSYAFRVSAEDGAGNESPQSSAVTATPVPDTTPPDTTITAGPTGTSSSDSATFEFTATEAGSTFECNLDGAPFAACASPRTVTGLADGPHVFSVRATDPAGNTDASEASRSWTVKVPDTTPPDTTITAGPAFTSTSSSASFEFTSTEAGSTFECRLDSGAFAGCSSPRALSALSDGLHTFSVRAIDQAGNADPSPATRTWNVDTFIPDTTPPDTAITSGPVAPSGSRSATFEFASTEAGSTFECRLDGAPFAACSSPSVLTGLSDGEHTFAVRARDTAQNVDPTPASRTFVVVSSSASLDPSPGPAASNGSASRPTAAAIRATLRVDLAAAARSLRALGGAKLVRRRGFVARDLDALMAGTLSASLTGTRLGAGRARATVLAQGSASASSAGRLAVNLRLTPVGRRLLDGDRRAKVTLTLMFRDRSGRTVSERRVLVLRR